MLEHADAGQEVEVDLEKDILTDITSGKQYPLKSIGEVSLLSQDLQVVHSWACSSVTKHCCGTRSHDAGDRARILCTVTM